MRKVLAVFLFLLGMFGVERASAQTFTFQCVCDYVSPPDCDICNTQTQSRLMNGLLIRKSGAAFKWIEYPYLVRVQGQNAVIQELVFPNPETVTINLAGTGFATMSEYMDSLQCNCGGGGGGVTYIAGPGIVISGDTISAVDTSATNEIQQIDTFAIFSGNQLCISLSADGVVKHCITLPSGSADTTIVTAGTGISVTGDGSLGDPYIITNTGDLSNTNEIQRLDTFAIVSGVLRASLLNDGVPFSSVTLPTADGSETKVNAGTAIGVTGTGTTGSPYVVTNTADLSVTAGGTNALQIALNTSGQTPIFVKGVGQVTVTESATGDTVKIGGVGGIYGTPDTTTGNHIATIAADRTLTFRAQDDDAGGIVPFRVTSTGNEPDILGLYADEDSLVFGRADTEMRVNSSTGLLIAAANTLALQGDSVQVQTLPTAPSTEKTYVVQGTDAYLRTREGVPLSHLTQSGATTGQVPKWDGSAWVPDDDTGGGGGSSDSTWVKSDGTFGSDTLDNVRRTGKISLNTTSTDGQITIGRDSASATPAIVARYKDASNGAFNFFSLRPISQTGNGGGLLGNFNFWATNFPGANEPHSSRANHVWRWGYNVGGGGGRIISTDATLENGMESNFYNVGLDGIRRRQWELHFQSQDVNGIVHRFITANGSHNGEEGGVGFNSDGFYFSRYNNLDSWLTVNRFAKTFILHDSMPIIFEKNGVGAGGIFQRNAANTSNLNLMYADASDRIVNGGTGVTSVYMPAGKLDIAGTGEIFNTSGYLLTVGTASAPTTLRVNANGSEALTLKSVAGGSAAWTTYVNSGAIVHARPDGNAFIEAYTNAPYTVWANNKLGIGSNLESRLSITQIGNGAQGGIGLVNLSGTPSYLQTNASGHFSFINQSGVERWSVAQDGQMNLGAYTSTSSFPVTAAGALVFNSSGNIGTSTFDSNPSDDVTGSGVSGRATFWNGAQTVTSDADWTFDGLNQSLGGSLTANGQSTNLARFGSIAAAPEYPGIWFGDATPSFSNYAVLWDNGAQALALNAPSGGYLTGKINNSEIWRTNTTGLGIGTAPSEKLHVSGNARITGAIYDSNNDPGTSGQILSSTVTGTDWVAASTLGDNWGSQTITTTGTTLSGVGTAGSPLKVATDGIGPTELEATAVTPGSYLAANVTVDADGRITAASSGSIAYQTLRDDGVDKVQRFNVNFVSTSSVNAALTDDGGNNETEVRMSVATDGITATEIAAGAVGASELSSLGTAGTYGSATQVPVFTTDADGRVSAVTNTSITGTLSGLTATRVPFASSATALTDDANLTWENTNKRLSIGNTGGSPAASLHIAEGSVASWEPLRAVGTVSGNMITTISNAQNSGGASNNLVDLSVGGASAGDAAYRWLINGVDTWSMGIDNSDADKWKLKKATTPSSGSNVGITMTADATPLIGINNDAPLHPLHVIGRATATVLQGISGTPTHTFGAGAGTGPSLGTLTGCTNGFNLQITIGTTPTVGGNIVSVTFPTAFSNLSFPTYSCGNDVTALENAAGKFVISAASATALTIKHNALTPALTAGDVLFFRFNTSGR